MFEAFVSDDGNSFRRSPIRRLAGLINDPSIVSFAGGVPSPATFPTDTLAPIAERVIRESGHVALQYGPTRGLRSLREHVSSICGDRGIDCSADDVIVTTGSQQGLALVAHALIDPGDVVLVELPSYVGALSSFYGRRARLAGVEQDEEGVIPAAVEDAIIALRSEGLRVKLLYTIPNFQNPSGRLLSPSRREDLARIADKHDILVIEDDPYGELVYTEGCDTTPIRAGQESSRVVYLGSFSKVLAAGLRCGWIVAHPELGRKLELGKEAADLCSGMLDQSIVAAFLGAGELPGQIEKVRAFYRARRASMIEALERHFSDLGHWTPANGGLFTFVTLGWETDTASWIDDAIRAGVAFVPGGAFFVDGSGANTMRLTFAKEPDDRIRDGIARLAEVVRIQMTDGR